METVLSTNLTHQVQEDYLSYSLSVLIGRAIPALTDGCKPVARRILTAMKKLNLQPDAKYMKSARVEGEVMGKYHPHGSSYGAMVTLASPWNNNLPLIDGHGNWGSSVDPAASSRYTECRLSPFAWDCLLDDSETWQLADNYDGSLKEPTELNVKIPAVLLNGQEGIGVGYACRIPPHDLRDICTALIDNTPLIPSFPSGCDIVRDEGLIEYQNTGSGSIRCRARVEVGTQSRARGKTRATLSFTNLPPGCNPEKLGEQIKSELEKNRLDNIAEVIDESDRSGDRVTVVAKPGADIAVVQRQLFAYTDLDVKYPAKLLVIDDNKPCELSPTEVLSRWKNWRLAVLERKFSHELDLTEKRLEIVTGFIKAIDKIDAIIKTIRASASKKDALIALVDRPFKFTRDQADAILEMRLHRLTNLSHTELIEEKESLNLILTQLTGLLKHPEERLKYLKSEVKKIAVRYGEKRRSSTIDPPEPFATPSGTRRASTPTSKPRFLKIDTKRGTIEQSKGPRGCLILEKTDKLIALTQDGTLKKVSSNFKGPLSDSYSPVLLAKKEQEVATRNYLVVFALDGALKAMTISGDKLTKTTSTGKNLLSANAEIIHFSENPFTVTWKSPRKKPTKLDLTVKPGKPGGKGVKIANLSDVVLSEAG